MRPDPSIFTFSDWASGIAGLAINDHDCQQLHSELAALLDYLRQYIQPRTVLEIGGWAGGSAWAWFQIPTVQRVITVTLPDSPLFTNGSPILDNHIVIADDSTRPNTVQTVSRLASLTPVDFLFIDGNHEYAYALADWINYGPLVAPGGLIALHDINDFPNHPTLQVHQLWADLAREHRNSVLIERPGADCGTGLIYP